ncbi:MAG: TIGR02147 family protein [Chitinispirillaceae bacterium]|nr:TIGR02147 family protein [Chitinispirillaceae bacterium]
MVNLFEYQNYRDYLKAYYNEQKASKKSFSYRSFSKKAGIQAPSFLFYVIDGKRNLTKNSLLKISGAIGHTREETDYFENLVFFNQADNIHDKSLYYSRIVEVRKPFDIQIIPLDRYEYYSVWYHSVIREVVTFFDFKENYAALGAVLIPPISPKQARDSIALLEKLGFIERDQQGLFHQTSNVIGVHPVPKETFIIEKFQMEMLQAALQSYERIPIYDRMSSSTTFSISEETFKLFKLKAREFRKELAEIARLDSSQERVYQLTMNLFPVCRRTGHDKA